MFARLRRRALAPLSLGASLVVLFGGCADDGSGDLALRWRFADGRDCTSSSVEMVVVSLDGQALDSVPCLDGFESPRTLHGLEANFVSVVVSGNSREGATLYRGERDVWIEEGDVTGATVVLRYLGGVH